MITAVLVVLLIIGFFGLVMTPGASSGVGIIAFACLLGILARIAQASRHHDAVMKASARETTNNTPQ